MILVKRFFVQNSTVKIFYVMSEKERVSSLHFFVNSHGFDGPGDYRDGSSHFIGKMLLEYFEGRGFIDHNPHFVEFSWCSKEMEEVYLYVMKIPHGSIKKYGEVAEDVFGSKKMARKAGKILAMNKIPLLIPCHRVWSVRGPGGYTQGGPEVKSFLISHEIRLLEGER